MICDVCGEERDPDAPSCPNCLKIRLEKFPGQQPRKSGTPRPMMEVEERPVVQTIEKKQLPVDEIKKFIPVIVAVVMIVIAGIAFFVMSKDTNAVEMMDSAVVVSENFDETREELIEVSSMED